MREEYAYKMFNKDLTCTRGSGKFQYTVGEWIEEPEANCAKNGFHCAENPLDCLTYYPDWDNSVCYLVQIGGDIDEDDHDTKISCTKIKLVKELTLDQFISRAVAYMIQHPMAQESSRVYREKGETGKNHFVFARGKDPKARGRIGETIVLLKEQPGNPQICAAASYEIDGKVYRDWTWYDVWGKAVEG